MLSPINNGFYECRDVITDMFERKYPLEYTKYGNYAFDHKTVRIMA
ncbi:hypothetical protein [Thermoplasma acidophilum]|nr:hypothetical protein [Thermoplasma acidophilum]